MDRTPESSSAHATATAASASAPAAGIEVAVVVPSAGQGAVYPMYEARDLSAEGVTLHGGLLLEKNEEITLELRLPDRGPLRARARVAGHNPDGSLRATFVGLDETDRQRLGRAM